MHPKPSSRVEATVISHGGIEMDFRCQQDQVVVLIIMFIMKSDQGLECVSVHMQHSFSSLSLIFGGR